MGFYLNAGSIKEIILSGNDITKDEVILETLNHQIGDTININLAQQDLQMRQQTAQADIALKAQKQKADEVFKAGKLDLDQQKLATDIIKQEKGNQMEKEKLASKIIDSAMISESYR